MTAQVIDASSVVITLQTGDLVEQLKSIDFTAVPVVERAPAVARISGLIESIGTFGQWTFVPAPAMRPQHGVIPMRPREC